MAHNFVSSGNRLTVGSQTAAGIANPQKLPYESSAFGGLSILNGPVQIGVAPLLPVPKGVLDVGPSTPTSGPSALAAINVNHPLSGIVINSFKTGITITASVSNVITAPENYFNGNVKISLGALRNSHLNTCTGTSCTFGSSTCLLYTSDADDERSSVDLGGRSII